MTVHAQVFRACGFGLLLHSLWIWSSAANAQIWDAGSSPADYRWSVGQNWDTNTAPVSNLSATNITLAGNVGLNTRLDSNFDIKSLSYASSAGSFNIAPVSGMPRLSIGSGGITQTSSATQTIAVEVNLAASQTWSIAAGSLELTRPLVSTTAATLVKEGAGRLYIPSYGSTPGSPGSNPGGIEVKAGVVEMPMRGSFLPPYFNTQLNGGVISNWGADRTELGTGPGQVQFTGSGGFAPAANPNARQVTFWNSTPVWGVTPSFLKDGYELILDARRGIGVETVAIASQFDLGTGTRTIRTLGTKEFDSGFNYNSANYSDLYGGYVSILTGAGGFEKVGDGALTFDGTSIPFTTYSGDTRVREGVLRLMPNTGLGKSTAGTIVEAGATLEVRGALTNEPISIAGRGVNNTGAIRLPDGGRLDFTPITLTGNAAIGTNALSGTREINASISGPYSLTKVGTGFISLGASFSMSLGNTFLQYTGNTVVESGGISFYANSIASPVIDVWSGASVGFSRPFTFSAGQQLTGSGEVVAFNDITFANNSTHSPGSSVGAQIVRGNYRLNAGADLQIELLGSVLNSQYDQVDVRGTVQLGGNLKVTLGFQPTLGAQFTILANDNSDAITGTFLNLPNDAVFAVGSTSFRIDYFGGSGNDIVLTVVPEAASIIPLAIGCFAVATARRRKVAS